MLFGQSGPSRHRTLVTERPALYPITYLVTLTLSAHSLLAGLMPQIREQHINYVTELARVSNEITTTHKDEPQSDRESKQHRDLALRGLKLLSYWNSTVTELVSHRS